MADLARIEMSPSEQKELQKDLRAILDYVGQLKKAPVDARQGPSFFKSSRTVLNNVFREDEPIEDKSDVKKGEHIRVKHIL